MISIVICSRSNQIKDALSLNIKKTIGNIKYEIIAIDNSYNQYSIFSAYNKGLNLAKYPIVCFMHEDVLFQTTDWGEMVKDCFDNPHVGLCGVIGSKFISKVPCGWWLSQSRRGHIIEKRKYGDFVENYSLKNKELVATVDGVWFCIRKNLFSKISFDEKTFKGFHCYDMDISLQILQLGYQLQIMPSIELYHKSQGCTNDIFYLNYLLLLKKWNDFLPVSIDIDENEKAKNMMFVNSYVKGISKENYFYRYTTSLVFKSLCLVDKIFNLKNIFSWTYFKGFRLYTVIANNKYLRKLL